MANRIVIHDELKHFGVLGMHWGDRKDQKKGGKLNSAAPEVTETKPTSKHPSTSSAEEQKKWAANNDKYFSESQKKAFTTQERMMLSDMGSNYSPKRAEEVLRLDPTHHPFADDGFGNHYALMDQDSNTYEYNHETDKYRDTKIPLGKFVRDTYDQWHQIQETKEPVKKKKSSTNTDQWIYRTAGATAARILSQSDLTEVEDFLAHHGVKDMKWGIRRFQRKDGTRTPLGRAREESEDYVKARENKTKGTESLSNEELKRLNERLRLEADYKALTTAKIEKAESFVGEALKKAGSQALTSFASSIMLGAAKSIVKEISPSLAEAAGFGVKAAAATVVAATQAPKQAPAPAPAQAPPQLTKKQRKAAAAAARNKS